MALVREMTKKGPSFVLTKGLDNLSPIAQKSVEDQYPVARTDASKLPNYLNQPPCSECSRPAIPHVGKCGIHMGFPNHAISHDTGDSGD